MTKNVVTKPDERPPLSGIYPTKGMQMAEPGSFVANLLAKERALYCKNCGKAPHLGSRCS